MPQNMLRSQIYASAAGILNMGGPGGVPVWGAFGVNWNPGVGAWAARRKRVPHPGRPVPKQLHRPGAS